MAAFNTLITAGIYISPNSIPLLLSCLSLVALCPSSWMLPMCFPLLLFPPSFPHLSPSTCIGYTWAGRRRAQVTACWMRAPLWWVQAGVRVQAEKWGLREKKGFICVWSFGCWGCCRVQPSHLGCVNGCLFLFARTQARSELTEECMYEFKAAFFGECCLSPSRIMCFFGAGVGVFVWASQINCA